MKKMKEMLSTVKGYGDFFIDYCCQNPLFNEIVTNKSSINDLGWNEVLGIIKIVF